MNNNEKKALLSVSLLFTFRMLGLFLILPVFALYAEHLEGANAALTGLALGIYGLTQACLQAPFGMLSDRYGRKLIITIGFILFGVGSLIASFSTHIDGVILGRALQGSGAIGSTLLAYLSDLIKPQHRAKAMAILGMSIGVAFSVAMSCSVLLNSTLGTRGIFALSAVLAVMALVILWRVAPLPENPPKCALKPLQVQILWTVLRDKRMLCFNALVSGLHALLTALFLVLPIFLTKSAAFPIHRQWVFYFPVLLLAFFTMFPLLIFTEKKRKFSMVLRASGFALLLSVLLIYTLHAHVLPMAFGLFIFFTAFTLLEALLPSLVSRIAPEENRGAAMGFYSACQFFGMFLGGALGGWTYAHFHIEGIFLFCSIVTVIWLAIANTMTTISLPEAPVESSR